MGYQMLWNQCSTRYMRPGVMGHIVNSQNVELSYPRCNWIRPLYYAQLYIGVLQPCIERLSMAESKINQLG